MDRRRLTKASLLLNLLLLAVVAYQFHRPATPSGPLSVSETESGQSRFLQAPDLSGQPNTSGAVRETPGPTDWRQIASSNYAAYIANLRAIGCPEQTIRDIITADINKRYNDRKAGFYLAAKGPFTFWATDDHTQLAPAQSAELTEKLAQCERERHAVLAELLGSGFGDDQLASSDQQVEKQRRLTFLPEEKQNQLRALDDLYPDLDEQIHALVDGRSPINDPEQLQQLIDRYSRKRTDLSQLLTQDEYEQYELSTSWTADNLRRRLVGFDPTEAEFKTIFQLWRAHDEALASVYALQQPEPGNLEVFAAIKQFLGAERYEQYRQAWGGQPVPPAGENSPATADLPTPSP